MLSSMAMPTLAVLQSYRKLQKNRSDHPAAYERVFNHSGSYYRYYSDEPLVCFAEALARKSTIKSDSYIFIQKVASNYYVAIRLENGRPYNQSSGALNTVLDAMVVDSRQVHEVYAALLSDDIEHINDYWKVSCKTAQAVPESAFNALKLRNKQYFLKLMIGCVFSVITLLLVITLWPDENYVKPAPNPWPAWRAEPVIQAEPVLTLSSAVAAQLLLLPVDYELGRVEILTGSEFLTAQIIQTTDVINRKSFSDWLVLHPDFAEALDPVSNIFQFDVNKKTRDSLVNSPTLPDRFYQILVELQPKSLTFESLDGFTAVTKIHAHWDGIELGALLILAELTDGQPIYIDSLTLEPVKSSLGQFSISINFVVETL